MSNREQAITILKGLLGFVLEPSTAPPSSWLVRHKINGKDYSRLATPCEIRLWKLLVTEKVKIVKIARTKKLRKAAKKQRSPGSSADYDLTKKEGA